MMNKATLDRAKEVAAWLDAHPHGATSLQVHAALFAGWLGLNTTQKLLTKMVREGVSVVRFGNVRHAKYVSPRHRDAAIAYSHAMRNERIAKKRERDNDARRKTKLELSIPWLGETPHQVVKRTWEPHVDMPSRWVFEWAQP